MRLEILVTITHMQGKTALVIGATGLIGQLVVEELVKDNSVQLVRLLVRNPLAVSHEKLEVHVVNFDSIDEITRKAGKGDMIFCCIGTTRKKVKGDKTEYRKIDHDIPYNVAWAGQLNGYPKYLLVSAVGANPSSDNFYLQLKGSAEEDISSLAFDSIHIFRPSLLLGKRKEFRTGEIFAKGLMQALSFVFRGSLSKYRAIQASAVAKAMIAASKKEDRGVHVYHYDEMAKLVSGE